MDRLRRQLHYDAWANRATADALLGQSPPPPRALRWMAHIVGAQWLWLLRLGFEDAERLAVWPELSPEETVEHVERLAGDWPRYLDGISGGELEGSIAYSNSKGERWTSHVRDVIEHVVIHSAYHRGQIAAELRASGMEPPYTDYIQATRGGMV
jgi:uncharacterized damage-inducible protein DinB